MTEVIAFLIVLVIAFISEALYVLFPNWGFVIAFVGGGIAMSLSDLIRDYMKK